jgi:hypothetical protein
MPETSTNILKQVWFSGLHASLAGGYSPHSFGDISLLWMISEVVTATSLEFDMPFLLSRLQENTPLANLWGETPEPTLPPQDRLAYVLGPKLKRIPGRYPAPPPGNIRNEFYHHSVAERIAGTIDCYPAGQAVVKVLPKAPFTKTEMEFALAAGLATEKQLREYWDPDLQNGD